LERNLKGGDSDPVEALHAELNPICHLLALLGAHHILYVSRIRVKAPPRQFSEGAVGNHEKWQDGC